MRKKPRRSNRSAPPAPRDPPPTGGDVGPADWHGLAELTEAVGFQLEPDQWARIAEVTEAAGIRSEEARPRIQQGIGLYRSLKAHDPELKRRLSRECKDAEGIRDALRELADRIEAFAERGWTIIPRWQMIKERGKNVEVRYPPEWPLSSGPALLQRIRRRQAKIFDEIRLITKYTADFLRDRADFPFDYLSDMARKERSILSRRSEAHRGRYPFLDSLVSELNQILYDFTGRDIERSRKKGDVSFPYVQAVCRLADPSLSDQTIWHAMRRIVEEKNKRVSSGYSAENAHQDTLMKILLVEMRADLKARGRDHLWLDAAIAGLMKKDPGSP